MPPRRCWRPKPPPGTTPRPSLRLRAELNRRYDAYVAAYGPVNRCSFREVGRPDEAGERRLAQFRPPRGGFAKDPFAGVVDALEIFDPETQHARKAPLLSRRVIAPAPARLGADTPEDALAICLDERAKVDLAEVARLLGVEPGEARERLGRLVFDDPGSGQLLPAAEYLSGNVREKLAAAREAALDDPALPRQRRGTAGGPASRPRPS